MDSTMVNFSIPSVFRMVFCLRNIDPEEGFLVDTVDQMEGQIGILIDLGETNIVFTLSLPEGASIEGASIEGASLQIENGQSIVFINLRANEDNSHAKFSTLKFVITSDPSEVAKETGNIPLCGIQDKYGNNTSYLLFRTK